jgi:hypothetical protein
LWLIVVYQRQLILRCNHIKQALCSSVILKQCIQFVNYKADSLEQTLNHYACLTEGDVISIVYNNEEYKFDIIQCLPQPSVTIIDADIKFDFMEPKDYQKMVWKYLSVTDNRLILKKQVEKKKKKTFYSRTLQNSIQIKYFQAVLCQ